VSICVNQRLKNMVLNIVHKYIRIYLYSFTNSLWRRIFSFGAEAGPIRAFFVLNLVRLRRICILVIQICFARPP
jgi:hypothetical protein